MNRLAFCAALLVALVNLCTAADPPRRWSEQQAWEWYREREWLVGFNYVPSTACNTTEWWQKGTFDPDTIDRELGWAAKLGFNTTRAFLQYIVWRDDPEGFRQRFGQFLEIAAKHGITVMPVLFDDCAFGDPPQLDPFLGKQREPIPGMILPSWTPSPGRKLAADPAERAMLRKYVTTMLQAFGQDERVVAWDLFNEPMNIAGTGTPAFVRELFAWTREARPKQPLTVGVWHGDRELNHVLLVESDVISYHRYGDYAAQREMIAQTKVHGRPVICTEWMARLQGSRWETDLPLFKAERVGCYNWGLVNGRTQCQFAWFHKRGTPEPKVWFHDLFHADGRAYDQKEHAAIRTQTANRKLDFGSADFRYLQSPARPAVTEGKGFRFDGEWTRWTGEGPLGKELFYCNRAGGTATADIEGERIVLIHKAGPDCGIAEVRIDGRPAIRLDTYSGEVEWNPRMVIAEKLPAGRHRVTITVTGERHPKSSNAYIQLVGVKAR